MASRAREFFDQIINAAEPAAAIASLATSRQVETEYLEFKGGRIDDRDAKAAWSESLSGFANIEGGVLIWGLRAAKSRTTDGSRAVDSAGELDLVKKPDSLYQLLRDIHLQATIPPLSGVEIKFFAYDDTGAGFVICYVPEGSDKPYRADFDRSKGYFQRVMDNFVPIQHSLLRSLFYPRTRPQIHLIAKVHFSTATTRDFNLEIQNTGTATARQMVALIESDKPLWMITGDGQLFGANLAYRSEGGIKTQRLVGHQNLHPGDQRDMGTLGWNLGLFPGDPPNFKVAIYMADQSPAFFSLKVAASDVIQNKVLAFQQEESPE